MEKQCSIGVQLITTILLGTQTDIIQKDFISTKILSSFYRESEGFPQFLYKSHTVTQMVVLLCCILCVSYWLQGNTMAESAVRGYFCACLALIVYAAMYFPSCLVQRPHPAFWRMLQGWGCCYLMTLVACMVFSNEQFMQFLSTFIDEKLGQPLPEKSYGDNCEFYTPGHPEGNFANIFNALDIFVAGHVIGWMVKMWIMRDIKLAFFQSILFEVMEITFRHWLPNFYECWWDHIILDIIICNSGGILLAYYLMNRFGMKQYRWSLAANKGQSSFISNVKNLFITPNIEKHEWKVFSSTKRFLSVFWFIVFQNLCDLSFFFNKYVLWIEPSHSIMTMRIMPLGFLSILGARDYYAYISDETVTRMGPNAWLIQMIVLTEWLLFIKNYNGQFTANFPWYVKLIWSIIGSMFIAVLLSLIRKDMQKKKNISKEE